MYKPIPYDDNNKETSEVKYTFLEPFQARVKYPNGTIKILGYGIGEQISVLEPRFQSLVACYEILYELPLIDGSYIINLPSDIKLKRKN